MVALCDQRTILLYHHHQTIRLLHIPQDQNYFHRSSVSIFSLVVSASNDWPIFLNVGSFGGVTKKTTTPVFHLHEMTETKTVVRKWLAWNRSVCMIKYVFFFFFLAIPLRICWDFTHCESKTCIYFYVFNYDTKNSVHIHEAELIYGTVSLPCVWRWHTWNRKRLKSLQRELVLSLASERRAVFALAQLQMQTL